MNLNTLTYICDRLEGHRAIHPGASRGEMEHLVLRILGLKEESELTTRSIIGKGDT